MQCSCWTWGMFTGAGQFLKSLAEYLLYSDIWPGRTRSSRASLRQTIDIHVCLLFLLLRFIFFFTTALGIHDELGMFNTVVNFHKLSMYVSWRVAVVTLDITSHANYEDGILTSWNLWGSGFAIVNPQSSWASTYHTANSYIKVIVTHKM